MTELEFSQILDAADTSPKDIAEAASGLSEGVLRYKPSPEKWCILEILGHLVDVEVVYGSRLRQMLSDINPVIAPFDQDAWARCLNYLECPSSELIGCYGVVRHHNVRLLRTLKFSDLAKSAFHLGMKRQMTVAELVERMGGHGAAHLKQIQQLKTLAAEDGLRRPTKATSSGD